MAGHVVRLTAQCPCRRAIVTRPRIAGATGSSTEIEGDSAAVDEGSCAGAIDDEDPDHPLSCIFFSVSKGSADRWRRCPSALFTEEGRDKRQVNDPLHSLPISLLKTPRNVAAVRDGFNMHITERPAAVRARIATRPGQPGPVRANAQNQYYVGIHVLRNPPGCPPPPQRAGLCLVSASVRFTPTLISLTSFQASACVCRFLGGGYPQMTTSLQTEAAPRCGRDGGRS